MNLRINKSVIFTSLNIPYSMTDAGLVNQICDLVRSMDNLSINDRQGQSGLCDHLDLATRNSPGGYWDRRTLTYVGRNLPHEFREYLLEVKTVDENSMLHKLCKASVFSYLPYLVPKDLTHFFNLLQDSLVNTMESSKNPRSTITREEKIEEIRQYLRVYRNLFTSLHDRRFELIIEYCTDPAVNVDDSELTIEVLETFFGLEYLRVFVFDCMPAAPWNVLEVVLRHANERRFDFWGIRRGTGPLCEQTNPVAESFYARKLFNGEYHMARLFLNYGFQYSYRYTLYSSRCRDFQNRSYAQMFIGRHEGATLMMRDEISNFRMMLSIETMSMFAMDFRQRENALTTLAYVWRSIPEPYLTPRYMFNAIRNVVNDRFVPWLVVIFRAYRNYRSNPSEHFEQSDVTYQPRTLKHLCRCQIRHALAENLNLPDGIMALDRVPPVLKDYLNLLH